MADTTEGDTMVHYLGLLVPGLMALIAGLVIHSFIIGVNVNNWWKGGSVTPVDHIVTSLGISRMCGQCLVTMYLFQDMLLLGNMYSVSSILLDVAYCFLVYINMWLTALLSIVLCLKISNLHTRLFLFLRRMILHRTGYFIVVSVIFSALNTLMTLLLAITEIDKSGTYNITMDNLPKDCIYVYSVYNITIGTFIPILLYSISSVLLFTSLYHHTTRMKMSSKLSINLETYYSVMRFVSFTFIYNTIYFSGQFGLGCYYYLYCLSLLWLYIVLEFLPALHSSYLIYSTASLRSEMSKVLHNVMPFLFHRKDTADIQENIEIVDR